MTEPGRPLDHLLALPGSARRTALEELVIAEFRATLRLPDEEEIPLRTGFFELGMTSLRLTEIRQRLTRLLGGHVPIEVLFEHANLASLLDHLAEVVLAEPAGGAPDRSPAELRTGPPKQLDDVLGQLYR